MKKSTIILLSAVGVLVILVVAVLVVLFRAVPKNTTSGPTITLNVKKGASTSSITTPNFVSTAPYTYTGGATLASQPGYAISYDSAHQEFNIAITEQPIAQYRSEAEAELLKDLGVSQAQACELNVNLGVTYNADPNLIDQNFGLSFCRGARSFPTQQ